MADKSLQQSETSSETASSKSHREINPLLIAAAAAVAIVILVLFMTGGFNYDNPSVQASVNDYSWEELQAISDKIANASSDDEGLEIAEKYHLCTADGKLDGTQTKDVTLTDSTQTSVQIAGFRHDDRSDGTGKAGITFIFKDAISYQKMNPGASNSGGWESSQMRQWLAGDGMSLMPDDLKSAIVSVKKLTNNMGASKLESAVTETDDSLWLLSYNEVSGNYHEWNLDIGVQYGPIYKDEGSTYQLFSDVSDNSIRVKSFGGQPCYWWERSPDPYDSDHFGLVYTDGKPYYSVVANNPYGVVPGFCI